MKITLPENKYGLIECYNTVATQMGYADTSELNYDCRCINVAENIQDGFYEYYRTLAVENATENEVNTGITMLLAMNGPKVDKNLKANEVEVFDGFIAERK